MSFNKTLIRNANRNAALMGKYPSGNAPVPSGFDYSLLLDTFEYDTIPIVRPLESGKLQYLWYEYFTATASGTSASDEASLYDNKSLKVVSEGLSGFTPGYTRSSMIYYNNRTETASNNWHYLREVVSGWETGRINRLRFWVKIPAGNGYNESDVTGRSNSNNFHVGSYLRHGNAVRTSAETDNHHLYHYYNVGHEGDTWHQIIVDSHPNHRRSALGYTEHSVITEPYPISDAGLNYFDLMTWFYTETKQEIPVGSIWYYDGFELYEDPNDEDIEHIYSLWGVYNPTTDEIAVGWSRNKTISNKSVTVKYAFSSFYGNGGFAAHGTVAPNGGSAVMPNAPTYTPNGYNAQEWRSGYAGIAHSGQDAIYIALKHEDEATRFREIRIPFSAIAAPDIGGSN